MARVILGAGDDIVFGGNGQIIGTRGGSEAVTILSGRVTLDASFNAGGDRIILPGNASGYTGQVVGSIMRVSNGSITIDMPVGPTGLDLAFGDRTLVLRVDTASNTVMLGDQPVSSTPAPVDTPPAPEPANQAPELDRPIADQVIGEGQAWRYTLSSATFSDPDGDRLTYSARLASGAALPAWLSFDAATRTFSGTPPEGFVGAVELLVRASDGDASASDRFTLLVEDLNAAPVLASPIADQAVDEDTAWSFTIPAATFTDSDGEALVYSATLVGGAALPSWLSFDAATRTFSGTPPANFAGQVEIAVTASDGKAQAIDRFTLSVDGLDDGPVVAIPIPDQVVDEEATVSFTIPAGTFIDPDGDTLTYSASLANGDPLPDAISFDPDTLTFTGTAPADYNGELVLAVTASDGEASATAIFKLTIEPVNDAPLIDYPFDDQQINEADAWSFTFRSDAFLDVDGDTLTYSATLGNGAPLPAWLSFDAATRTFLGTPPAGVGAIEVTVTASDGEESASDSFTLTVNDRPTVEFALPDTHPVGEEKLVNTFTSRGQTIPAVATLADGSFVVTWNSYLQDGNDSGIYAQRFDINGTPVGEETQINSYTPGTQYLPSIAALADGGYVISWHSRDQDGGGYGIYAQRFDEAGDPVGLETQINTSIAGDQRSPSIAGLSDGGYVISWLQSGPDAEIFAQRFDASGASAGGEFRVNTYTSDIQQHPAVAALADGGYVITWVSQDGSTAGIYSQRYDAAGAPAGAETRVNSSTAGNQPEPAIAALEDGGYVISWTSKGADQQTHGVSAQRYDASGRAVGGEVLVNTAPVSSNNSPVVAALGDGGYVIGWISLGEGSSGNRISIQRHDADGHRVGQEMIVSTATEGAQSFPAIAAHLDDGFVVTWTAPDGSEGGVFMQRFSDHLTAIEQQALDLAGLIEVGDGDASGDIEVLLSVDYGILEIDAGTTGASVAGDGSDRVTIRGSLSEIQALLGGEDGSSLSFTADTRSPPATASLTVSIDDGFAVASDILDIEITDLNEAPTIFVEIPQVVREGEPTLVNTATTNLQWNPAVTALADGGHVVIWASAGQDDVGSMGVYLQRYDASGQAVGGETLVNTITALDQSLPSITALANGGFVASWQSNHDGGSGVYTRLYDASGSPAGPEMLEDAGIHQVQAETAVSALADGGYVFAWQTGIDGAVHAQRYDGSGMAVGARVTAGDGVYVQELPAVTGLADGGYVLTWQSRDQDGSGKGIYSQLYDASGEPVGGEMLVNSTTLGDQQMPSVAALEDGGYAIVWMSFGQGSSANDVYLQRYDASGDKVGGEILVNTTIAGAQQFPTVAGLQDGGYVVGWSSSGGAEGAGAYAQRFDANGGRVGEEFRIDPGTSGLHMGPIVTGLEDGGYLAAWTSSDGSGFGVYTQRFATGWEASEQQPFDLTGVIQVDDGDTSDDLEITLSLDHGLFDVDAGVTGADVSGDGTARVIISGTLAELQALLAGQSGSELSFIAGSDEPRSQAELTIRLDDGLAIVATSLSIPISAVPDL